jgi:3-deoxy-D-manno-octulosonic-acid transferase
MDKLNITHLVLSGGGMKGVIFIGALRYMYIENLHKNITHIAANSIGSFVALFIAFKLTIEEIEKIIYDSKDDKNLCYIPTKNYYKIISNLGLCSISNFMEHFKNNTITIVIGSSWPKDESLLVNFINQTNEKVKFIIAPHNIKADQIQELQNSITKKTVLFSEKENTDLSNYDVLIVDTIGILTKIYSYADIAYVGGGFGNPGVHNILEPATFGIPIVVGPNYNHFAEATALVHQEGCISINTQTELNETLNNLISNEDIRHEKGHICETFVQLNKGATSRILNHILNNKQSH